ncbi:DNA polymerase kappa subunit [Cryptococcus deuterogattii LA55]|nr:DNA polymerase kappa subunit [Cryptococcus deuterogattii LA55]KIR95833.1 DNA polymerase kappa subunit [Cryptococcus deuterogattii CBS 10090]
MSRPLALKKRGYLAKGDVSDEDRAAAEAMQRSFERSLAGPSVGKAGITRDQTEINRIIAEASKGSKFYNNQVRKDQELTEKIAWYRSKRDELMRMAPRDQLEAEADRILMEVEATRDLSQTIVHVDMDAFYASVEVQRDPSLKGKAFGVGKGVLCTASYEARKYGVRSAMASFIAKKLCPHIILTDLHFDLYTKASKAVKEVLVQYDENLMMASLDEGYLNITPYMSAHNMTASEVVTQIRAQVEKNTSLTISAGIAANRMLAKICSDKNKPNGQFELASDRATIVRFMRDLPVRKIPGFGRVTERCLEGLEIETCGNIYEKRMDLLLMDHWFGFRGLCRAYLGIADNTVGPGRREERKSVGVERTFRDKTDDEEIMATLIEIVEELGKDLDRLQFAGKTVTVKYKLHTYENKTRAKSISKYISSARDILPVAQELLKKELPLRIRLLGVRLSTLKDLTVVEKGIKGFFKAAEDKAKTESPITGRPLETAEHVPEMMRLDAENARGEDFDAEEASGSEDIGAVDFEILPGTAKKRKSPSPMREAPSPAAGPICPICGQTLDPGTSNQQLNDHVDWCLSKDAIKEASRVSPVAQKKAKIERAFKNSSSTGSGPAKKGRPTGEKGTISSWLKKG